MLSLLLAGCRGQDATRGWVRLETLTALHPSQPMLDDLQRRMAGLRAQRQRLLGRTAPSLPPALITRDTASWAALPGPTALTPAPGPEAQVNALDLQALEGQLTRQRDLDYPRRTRELRARLEQAYLDTLDRLRRDAAARRAKINEQYKQRITRYELSVSVGEQADEQPLHYPELAQHVQERKARLAALRAQSDAELAAVNRELQAAEAAAYEDFLQNVAQQRAQLWEQMTDGIALNVAAERERLAGLLPAPEAATPPLTFPDLPAGTFAMEHPALQRDFAGSLTRGQADLRASVAAIDDTLAKLAREYDDLHAAIEDDTRRAAENVAAQHGRVLGFAPEASPELTNDLRGWLAGYWPARAE